MLASISQALLGSNATKAMHVRNVRTHKELLTFGLSSYVGYRAQGGRTNFPQMEKILAFAPLGRSQEPVR
ncbi:hypothetical protein SEA_MODRAGONS_78 [Mycobacterium phage Modragons]|uniref:Uncharacterized protein n=1 Tax=Mycobacterium phage Ochi17 TaxID=2502425 RepID=A0A411BTK3_9CAUD|nr:hypothetical protein KNU45_gp079 [Mycobacterium phage Ochi17]QFP96490.1 hypothetical protein SEA_MODRAGONS_78 [Mycobacterium phage Modragons]QOP67164.1 hypothetical protein SEA_SEABASTIAN_81 [Mycobacterium phage Seabastian]QOP67275.1 hypothetical protein SEA_OFULTRON_81 [Mycobacterium phage OfUltron]WNM64920.1 hypothetical protein SEA_ALPINESIX_80 [Mycobacterium phage AlpineSix]QAY04933.1 hypothetical protein SEA_OCHI17_79 [Mycobacterium phage Ochi17]